MILFSALTLGLAGSFHCAGMCGPIALAIPVNNKSAFSKITGILLYNSGRVVTYALMGLIIGLVGEGFKLAGFQQIVSIVTGAFMFLIALLSLFYNKISLMHIGFISKFLVKVKNGVAKRLSGGGSKSLFVLGILNGLLPCGLVYMALATAIAASDLLMSTLAMVLFGLGTIPMMALITFAGNQISVAFRNKVNKAIPYFVMVIAVVFILRGLGLGIPYLSPADKALSVKNKVEMKQNVHTEKKSCCQ